MWTMVRIQTGRETPKAWLWDPGLAQTRVRPKPQRVAKPSKTRQPMRSITQDQAGQAEGQAAEGYVSQASAAVTRCTGMEHVAPHPANPHFGPQTTASGAVFMDQSSKWGTESPEYGDICPPFPRGDVVSSSAWANLMPTTASVHTMCTTTLTSTTVTCTAQGGPP